MTRLIDLPERAEEIVMARAQERGKSVEEYLPELIMTALTQPSQMPVDTTEDRAARKRRFRQWADSNGHDTPYLSDEAISREAMYSQS